MDPPAKPKRDGIAISNIAINGVLTALSFTSLVVTVIISRNVIDLRDTPASEERNDGYLQAALGGADAPAGDAADSAQNAALGPALTERRVMLERDAFDPALAAGTLLFAKGEIDSCLDKFDFSAAQSDDRDPFCEGEVPQVDRFLHLSEMATVYTALMSSKIYAALDAAPATDPELRCPNGLRATFPSGTTHAADTYFGTVSLSRGSMGTGASLGVPVVTCGGAAVVPRVSEPHTDTFNKVPDIAGYRFGSPGTYKVYWITGDHVLSKVVMVEDDAHAAGVAQGAYGILAPKGDKDYYSFQPFKPASLE